MPVLIAYKKAHLNYEILEQFEAGLELAGYEVKALRQKLGSLDGSHVVVRGSEAFLVGAHIPAYQPANAPKSYDPTRARKLLLSPKEIGALGDAEGQKGLTVVPISLYTKGRYLKLSVGIARGKKKYDKREDIKRRDTQRDVEREINTKFS